jgi:predicted dehydrogenase
MSRRKFIKQSGALTGAVLSRAFLPPLIIRGKKNAPGEKIRIALIGARSMGWGDLQNAVKQPGIECIGLCDIDRSILQSRSAELEKLTGQKPTGYGDFRKLLDQKDLDAVIIGTPDHWHCLPFLYACEAGKDIYVEKPLANSIGECNLMARFARQYKRVVQVGQQQRSGDHWNSAKEFIQSGKIGQLRKVNVWGNFRYGIGQKIVPDGTPPGEVDFDFWLGPAPKRSFNAARFHGNWRMFWDYGGGLLTDWGVHLLDIALWVKDIRKMPDAAVATGGNFAFKEYAHETFDTMNVSWQTGDHIINWEQNAGLDSGPYGRLYGLEFVGNDGRLVIDRRGWELYPEIDPDTKSPKVAPMAKVEGKASNHETHMINFLDCMRSRKDPVCPIEAGQLVASYAHMGNIALRTQSRLSWNEKTGDFGKNKAANELIRPAYRKPWVLPK